MALGLVSGRRSRHPILRRFPAPPCNRQVSWCIVISKVARRRNLLITLIVLALSGVPAMLPEIVAQSHCPYCSNGECCMMHHCNMGKAGHMTCPMARGAHHCGHMSRSCSTQGTLSMSQGGYEDFHYDLPRSFAVASRPALNGRLSPVIHLPLEGHFHLPDHVPRNFRRI